MPKVIMIAVMLGGLVVAPASAADEKNNSSQNASGAVLLLSERDLENGFKVCFLSNGLQLRRPISQSCPFPQKANFLEPAQTRQTGQAPSTESITASTVTKMPELERSDVSYPSPLSLSTQEAPSLKASAEKPSPSIKPDNQSKPTPQINASRPIVSSVTSAPSPSAKDAFDDPIADKAIRRCERIGFKEGTEPFKSCALEQIRILSDAPSS